LVTRAASLPAHGERRVHVVDDDARGLTRERGCHAPGVPGGRHLAGQLEADPFGHIDV
jgi:hypothetical protein